MKTICALLALFCFGCGDTYNMNAKPVTPRHACLVEHAVDVVRAVTLERFDFEPELDASVSFVDDTFCCGNGEGSSGCWHSEKIIVKDYELSWITCGVLIHEFAHDASSEMFGSPDPNHENFPDLYDQDYEDWCSDLTCDDATWGDMSTSALQEGLDLKG